MDYIKSPSLHKYLIKLPDKFSPEKQYPLVIGLHGGGGAPNKFIELWDELPEIDFIYAAPQGPYPMVMNDELCFDWGNWPSGDENVIKEASQLTEQYIRDVSLGLSEKYNSKAVFLMGFSQGAIFTYIAGLKGFDIFKGLIILSGPGLLEPINNPFTSSKNHDWLSNEDILKTKKMRVFITHGKNDPSVNYELGIKSWDLLSKLKHEVTFRDFEGEHNPPPKPILEEIAQWIVRE